MTKEQEAQQAQTIAEITARLENDEAWMSQSAQSGKDYSIEDRGKLLKIVDSQAQKIAEQAKEIERLKRDVQWWKPSVYQTAPEQTADSKEAAR